VLRKCTGGQPIIAEMKTLRMRVELLLEKIKGNDD
jgi:uncharacterized protein (DUF433 family)